METLRRFASLFWGRPDAYFLSLEKGGRAVYAPPNLQLFRRHLRGDIEIGTYPVRNDARCRWSCIDIDDTDEGKAWDGVTDLFSVWKYFGVTSWIERSRSKGYHCWVFLSEWCPATVVRNAGLYVNSIAGDPSKEVNPKNDAPWKLANGLVNTVRTPYSGRALPGRMVVVNAEDKSSAYPLRDFVYEASSSLALPHVLADLASRWRARVQRNERLRRLQISTHEGSESLSPRRIGSAQDAYRILTGERSVPLGERDNQFWTMACLLHAKGTTYGLALRMVETAWREQVTDKFDFPLSQALEKVHRKYRD